MLFSFPGNHCEYSLMLWWVKWLACLRAISRRTVSSIGSDPSSRKFVFFNQPAEVVLSVIDRAQSPGRRRFEIRSIQGVTIDTMNSRRLFEAWKRQSSGSSNLQAKPSCEYPPNP